MQVTSGTNPILLSNLDAIIQGQASATFGGARTTAKLLAILGTLDKSGIPDIDHILSVERPFPVAGLAYWVDDWHAYRCCPKPHLHQGVDMMADRGTPLVSVADGVISGVVNDPAWSGLGVAVTDRAGTRYFYAHLDSYASPLRVGQPVRMGQVIGYVGNSGDAAGGPTHLHFEVHPGGGVAVPPKPFVDSWLDIAQIRAMHLVHKLTGKHVSDKNLNLNLWKNKLYELAQHEIQAANLLAVRNHAAAVAQQQKAKPGVDQQTLPYTLPVVLLAFLAGALLVIDRRRVPAARSRRRRREDDEDLVDVPHEVPHELELAIIRDMEAAFASAETGVEQGPAPIAVDDWKDGEAAVSSLSASPGRT